MSEKLPENRFSQYAALFPHAHERVVTRLTLLDELAKAKNQNDEDAQREILGKIRANELVLQPLCREQRASMTAACNDARAETNDEVRVEKLLKAFELCAQTHVLAAEHFFDNDGINAAIEHKRALVADLAAIQPDGRLALSKFLDHPNDSVRASAAAHLLFHKLLRPRVRDILNHIDRYSDSLTAQLTANFSVMPPEWRKPPGGEGLAERNDFII